MPYDPHLHHRRSVRLEGFDYSQNGAYFVTVCAHERQTLFGRLVAGDAGVTVELSEAGAAAQSCWLEIPRHFPLVTLDAFIVMPDHLHGILFLSGHEQSSGRVRGANDYSPLQGNGTSLTVGSVVRGFKIGVTKWFKENQPCADKVWQRSYYEHVIRNDNELDLARQYILENPAKLHEHQ
ncbi:transposase [Geomonas subterranea]|uniref:Transposase n=1 Tax=Geomonas subterranea TaxID=2847989 RepID=A0ABX8LK23_9BACT|nr:transposase [Geomonas subterranea]QXE90699.1 transposase [Geomonas subterranea]QXM11219.1 transposase [Geomonas subterranea]